MSFRKPAVKLVSVGSSIPGTPPVSSTRQEKKAANMHSLKTDPAGEDFELVEHGELDEDLDLLFNDGPSASNGTSTPDPDIVMNGLEGAFRSLGKSMQDWKREQ